jgi:hypothetical protein
MVGATQNGSLVSESTLPMKTAPARSPAFPKGTRRVTPGSRGRKCPRSRWRGRPRASRAVRHPRPLALRDMGRISERRASFSVRHVAPSIICPSSRWTRTVPAIYERVPVCAFFGVRSGYRGIGHIRERAFPLVRGAGPPRFELGLTDPESVVLPLHHGPPCLPGDEYTSPKRAERVYRRRFCTSPGRAVA